MHLGSVDRQYVNSGANWNVLPWDGFGVNERVHCAHTLCLKKVPIFKLSVTSSNLNDFQTFALLESL